MEEEPGRLKSVGSQKNQTDRAIKQQPTNLDGLISVPHLTVILETEDNR